jgi:hypothetical protein
MMIRGSGRRLRASLVLAAVVLVVASGSHPARAGEPDTTGLPVVVFVTRHAEKASEAERDPGLSAEGTRRAQALAALLGGAGVTHLAATEFRRTHETLGPLAGRVGVEPRVFEAGRTDELVRWLAGLPPGSVAVVAGHSNTVPAIVRGLGGTIAADALDEGDYGRLFQVIRPAADPGTAQVLELEFGASHRNE